MLPGMSLPLPGATEFCSKACDDNFLRCGYLLDIASAHFNECKSVRQTGELERVHEKW